MTFWNHLDALRHVMMRCLGVLLVSTIVLICFREPMFRVVMQPRDWGGITLINTELTSQFMTHMSVSFYVSVLLFAPYVLAELFLFISPGLYQKERSLALRLLLSSTLLFYAGVAFNYFLVYPVTVDFLGNYQVEEHVANYISLSSYIDTLLLMSIVLGISFEIPVVAWLLGRVGILRREWMSKYRRHAIVAIVVVAAILTPTGDAFTLLIVSTPMYLLYEISIYLIPHRK